MIICKTEFEIAIMREAGKIVALTHELIRQNVKQGITTQELDHIAEKFIKSMGAIPSFKGYSGFPANTCISINEELVHGIPSRRKLVEGDIVSIDIGAFYRGYHGDSAWTYGVGNIDEASQRLLDITEESLFKGLNEAKPLARLSNISHAIQTHVESFGYSVVREYVGHGIGEKLHEPPQIPNYGPPNRGPKLKPGMVLAIEPMIISGERFVRTLEDHWTVVTVDRSRCAHFEHTIVITDKGYEILTLP